MAWRYGRPYNRLFCRCSHSVSNRMPQIKDGNNPDVTHQRPRLKIRRDFLHWTDVGDARLFSLETSPRAPNAVAQGSSNPSQNVHSARHPFSMRHCKHSPLDDRGRNTGKRPKRIMRVCLKHPCLRELTDSPTCHRLTRRYLAPTPPRNRHQSIPAL